MTFPKLLLPIFAASIFLGGCVYEEVGYREPHRVYHSGYAEREVVVVNDRPRHYRDDYYRTRPVTVYNDRPRAVYGGGYAVAPGYHGERHGESYKERQERLVREAQRAQDDRHDKKDDDHKKKKKKDHDDDDH